MSDKRLSHLTASDFYKYVKCPNWIYWDLFGDQSEKGDVSPMMKQLREQGLIHEEKIIAELGDYAKVPAVGTFAERAEKTLELMKKGAIIYHGVLIDDDWCGIPDVLRPTLKDSKLGKWSYEAIDIKSAHELSDVHKYQLTFYSLLLEKIQGERPASAAIINADGKELSFSIADVYSEFFDILNRILAIRAKEKPDPFFTSACKESPWYETCKREAEKTDDVSLIYKLYKNEYKRLKTAGYGTIGSVAAADPETFRDTVPGITEARLERIRLQAKALHEKRTISVGDPDIGVEDTEMYFDIEGDPLLGVEYLFGLLIREKGEVRYEMFLAEKQEDEGKAWLAFCDFMEGYRGTRIYHYGWYEHDVVRRLSNKHGISKKAAEALSFTYMVDLIKVVQRSVIFPLYFYSLKDLAKFLGFKWRASDASGANSVLWFQDWLNKGDRKMLQKIIDYNEDDVRATMHLKDWLVSQNDAGATNQPMKKTAP